jgi:hypothetical protein
MGEYSPCQGELLARWPGGWRRYEIWPRVRVAGAPDALSAGRRWRVLGGVSKIEMDRNDPHLRRYAVSLSLLPITRIPRNQHRQRRRGLLAVVRPHALQRGSRRPLIARVPACPRARPARGLYRASPTWAGAAGFWRRDEFHLAARGAAMIPLLPSTGSGVGSVTGCGGSIQHSIATLLASTIQVFLIL